MSVRTRFSQQTLDQLFAAILVDDVIDEHIELPAYLPTKFSSEQLLRCLNLCQQLWLDGVSNTQLRHLTKKIITNKDLNSEERILYKYIRAKYKHMGFAFILYTASHKRPLLFEATSTLMGEAQDAFRNQIKNKTLYNGIILNAITAWPLSQFTREHVKNAQLDTQKFIHHFRNDGKRIPEFLALQSVTPAQFHGLRKIISRHVSFFDTLRTLYPDEIYYKMSRFLSAINGMMGNFHDELVQKSLLKQLNYRQDRIAIPQHITDLLEKFTFLYEKNK
ncbi:hypothetical protein ACI01nite_00050 [Acetobacter cibinongensis]|uniref:CHAD domain-containing protein n=1 Tax=Acetobacter cibinongensis TaxID=146475 RepID=A0A0D6N7P1_9PROT|nr:hypothetical protein [Acetobacter cibinongensis]GAN61511.1 hypothetical protein Abci_030_005 [Acetobacter cibinongensis]GBQ15955.1 hypothetical protein AA0482_1379 [Acetobacter cibinongensis NRIC 0482]GEL57403.1 hypothetical protein ACI01nite_00050 [Acetobacter cibinongensis]